MAANVPPPDPTLLKQTKYINLFYCWNQCDWGDHYGHIIRNTINVVNKSSNKTFPDECCHISRVDMLVVDYK